VVRTDDGLPPAQTVDLGTGPWERVWKLADVENLYDLGFVQNLKDVFWPRYGFTHRVENKAEESRSRPARFGSPTSSPSRI